MAIPHPWVGIKKIITSWKHVICLIIFFYLRFGPRFLATVGTWDDAMNELAEKAATELGLGDILRRGVYVMIGGPTFETVAESRLLKNFGADAVGE